MARRKRKHGNHAKHHFHSKAQWRWAFATKKPWARRWARKTPGGKIIRYRRLPRRKSAPGVRTAAFAGKRR